MRNYRHTLLRMGGAGLLATTLTISLAACGTNAASAATQAVTAQETTQQTQTVTEEIAQSSTANAIITTANYGEEGVIEFAISFTECYTDKEIAEREAKEQEGAE